MSELRSLRLRTGPPHPNRILPQSVLDHGLPHGEVRVLVLPTHHPVDLDSFGQVARLKGAFKRLSGTTTVQPDVQVAVRFFPAGELHTFRPDGVDPLDGGLVPLCPEADGEPVRPPSTTNSTHQDGGDAAGVGQVVEVVVENSHDVSPYVGWVVLLYKRHRQQPLTSDSIYVTEKESICKKAVTPPALKKPVVWWLAGYVVAVEVLCSRQAVTGQIRYSQGLS